MIDVGQEGSQPPPPELNQWSHHKRTRPHGLIEAKDERHPGVATSGQGEGLLQPSKAFLSQVMHNATLLSIMEQLR